MSYAQKLEDPRWQKKRLEVLDLAGWRCQRCGESKKTLHVHHTAYGFGEPWEIENRFLKVLCKDCHGQDHFRSLWLQREGLKEWPITLPGQEHFFGHVSGLGWLQDEKAPEGFWSVWVEFCYGNFKDRYDLPLDENLISQLWKYLNENIVGVPDSLTGKVWVRLTENGYTVELP